MIRWLLPAENHALYAVRRLSAIYTSSIVASSAFFRQVI